MKTLLSVGVVVLSIVVGVLSAVFADKVVDPSNNNASPHVSGSGFVKLGSSIGPRRYASSFPTTQWNVFGYNLSGKYCGKATVGYNGYDYRIPGCYRMLKVRAKVAPTPMPQPTATPQPQPATCNDDQSCALATLQLINQERSAHGVAPLSIDWNLSYGSSSCIGARGHSQHMAQTGQLAHDQFPQDVCPPYNAAGENIGEASYDEWGMIKVVMQQMLAEPWTPGCQDNHHCNILSSNYSRVGIGFAYGNGNWWLTQDFAG